MNFITDSQERLIPEFYASPQEKIFFKNLDIFPLHFLVPWHVVLTLHLMGIPDIWKILSSDSFLAIENVSTLNLFPVSLVAPLNQVLLKYPLHLIVRISLLRPVSQVIEVTMR